MERSDEFRALVAHFETLPHIRGRRIADIPELAELRLKARRDFYRNANLSGGLAVFNAILAVAPNYSLWPLSTIAAAVGVATVVFCESKVRAMNRQLKRRASEQMARDLWGIRD